MSHLRPKYAATAAPRDGFVLFVVLVVLAMLALSAYSFMGIMTAENTAAVISGRQVQARVFVDSGVEHLRYFLELDPATRQDLGGGYDNPLYFQGQSVLLGDVPALRGGFTVLTPAQNALGVWDGMRFGLADESARLNLNTLVSEMEGASASGGSAGSSSPSAGDSEENQGSNSGGNSPSAGQANRNAPAEEGEAGRGNAPPRGGSAGSQDQSDPNGGSDDERADEEDADDEPSAPVKMTAQERLMMLPGMTPDIADAILDWLDADDSPRTYGAEAEYYSSLDPPLLPRNGPLESLDELLQVRGVTPELLFGRDVNRNGMIDSFEWQIPLVIEGDDGSGALDRGWSAYLTIYSRERNVTSQGEPRIYLNCEDLQVLYDYLSAVVDPAWATYIVAYRQSGPYEGDTDEAEPAGDQALDLTVRGRRRIESLLDLVGGHVEARLADEEETVILQSPWSDDPAALAVELPQLMDLCTLDPTPTIAGRININQAPRAVLLTLPGMTEALADAILSQRDPTGQSQDPLQQSPAWLLTTGLITVDEMRPMLPWVTGRGDVFRAQIVGFFESEAVMSRAEVVIDATQARPRLLCWKELSHLGRGFPRELLMPSP